MTTERRLDTATGRGDPLREGAVRAMTSGRALVRRASRRCHRSGVRRPPSGRGFMFSDIDTVTEALDRLTADLRRTLEHPPSLSFVEAAASDHVHLTRRDVARPYVTSGGVSIHAAPLDVQERMARELCDALASGYFGDRVSWPTCPEHGTAVQARRQDDAVLWMCRGGGRFHCLALLGSLGAT